MGKVIYATLTSLDGYIADDKGNFDWAEPKEDVHSFFNKLELATGTIVLGKAMYETLSVWDDFPGIESMPAYIMEYQSAWMQAKKVVFSTSLREVTTARTTLRRNFAKAEMEELKRQEPRNIGIGGASIASQALSWGQLDEVYRFVVPVMVGSGKRWLSSTTLVHLHRIESRDFLNGVVMLHYRVTYT
jgi:dihydrofolate reductase